MRFVLRKTLSMALALCLCLSLLPALAPQTRAVTPTYSVSSSYKSSTYYDKLCDVVLTGNQRDDIINVALSQVGYREGSYSGDYNGAYDANYNNYTEYNYWYNTCISSSMPVGGSYAHWCATFVSWCAEQANIPTSILKRSTAAGHSYSYFNLNFYSGSSTLASSSDNDSYFMGYNYTPKKGDLFYTRSWSHVGLVVEVDGSYVTTVEGNTNNDGSADGFGVYVRSRRISDLYFGAPNYVVTEHKCDEGRVVGYESEHPHYSIYECTECGKQWTDTTTTNMSDNCAICQQPGKPAFVNLGSSYSDYEKIIFQWNPALNATHYNIRLEANNGGVWDVYEQISYASSGMEKTLPVGSYRCKLQAYNNNCWMEDGSDWIHTDGDYAYFTVSQTYQTITFDGNGGFCSIASKTVWSGGIIGELPVPIRNGYNFTGWYLNQAGTGNAVASTMVVNSDHTLYAQWEEEVTIVVPTLALSYPTLSFEDEIRYNVYYTVDNATSIVEMGLAVYAYYNTSGTVSNAMEVIPGYYRSSSYYVASSNGIPAKNLGDALYFKVYAKLSDGTYAYSDVAGYNAVT
ncbi:MAG: InlB B-repeat-containing protein, partial [Oscillospiraceae bacterium]|nr:InlB B-repeat-containing protein [Oscillospiraceae bacterium]